jgi:hypothetical protein
MGELQTLEDDFKTFLAKAETEGELLIAEGMAAIKNTVALLAKNPAVVAALKNGLTIAEDTVVGAVNAGGVGALAGALKGAATDMLKTVPGEIAPEIMSVVTGEINAAVAPAIAATPTVVNP